MIIARFELIVCTTVDSNSGREINLRSIDIM
jgi:hypothetical protein